MGLLRRNPRPSAPPGDWLDALQAAMWVDPSLKPKRDPRPGEEPLGDQRDDRADDRADPPPRLAPEVPRRFRPRSPDAPVANRPWLPPVPADVQPPAASVVPTAAPVAVEQLLQWVCRLSRMRRAAAATTFPADALRFEADHHLAAVAAAGPVGLRLRPALASFVDVVVTRGGLPVAGPWRPLGPVPPGPAYAAAAEAAAADPTGRHDGTWAAHHAALSLVADLVPDGPAVLNALDAKLNGTAGDGPGTDDHICPAAYEGVFDHAIVRPAARPVRAVAAAAVGLLLLSLAGAVLLNVRYVGQLRSSVDAVDRALRQPPERAATNGHG